MLLVIALVMSSWLVLHKSPRAVMQAFSRAAEICSSPSVRPPPVPYSIKRFGCWLLNLLSWLWCNVAPRMVPRAFCKRATELHENNSIRPPPVPNFTSFRWSCLLIACLMAQIHVICSLDAPSPQQMARSLSSSGKPTSYINVLMGHEETDLLSAALDQFQEQHKESNPPAQEGADEKDQGDGKSQVSQLTSGGHADSVDDDYGGGFDTGKAAFGSELAELLDGDKEAKAVMILSQLTHLMTSAAAAAAAAIGAQGQGTNTSGGAPGTSTATTGASGAPLATVKVNGLTLLQTERTDAELGSKDVQLSRYSCGSTDTEKIKIRKQHCVALPHKFSVMKVAEILAANLKVSIGSELLAQQIATDRFSEWTIKVDAANVLWVPDITNFSDPAIVAAAPRKFLLKDWKGIRKESVIGWQEFIHRWCELVDIESCRWILEVAELSSEADLLIVVKQSHDTLLINQRGGVAFLLLLLTKRQAKSYEHTKLLQTYLTSFRLSDTPGENVGIAASCFKAAATMLDTADLPTDLLRNFLQGMSHCSNEEFGASCSMQVAFLGSPMYDAYAASFSGATGPLQMLEAFASK
jgi:hypothetical protein